MIEDRGGTPQALVILSEGNARLAERQTRSLEVAVSERTCGFKSHDGHDLRKLYKADEELLKFEKSSNILYCRTRR